ncbi:MAG: DUF5074 domain-containing protein [Polaribacter sp.]
MKNFYPKFAFLCILFLLSCSKNENTPEVVTEPAVVYNNAFILSFQGDKTALSYLNSNKFATLNVYTSADANTISLSEFKNKLYLVSQKGPQFISQLNLENLNLETAVTTSKVASPSYLQMFSETDGVVISTSGRGRRKKYNLSFVNVTTGIGDKIVGFSNKVLFTNSALLLDGNVVLVADSKELKSIDITTKKVTTLLTFKENISGILKNKNGIIWVATEKRTEKATFTKLNEDYSINEIVTITDNTINLFKNSILTLNKNSVEAYWSESASGKIYRFNTTTKLVEEFVTPSTNGVLLTTVVKQNPVTKQVYVIGLEDFLDTDKSILAIYNDDKTLDKTVKGVGNSPIDIYFSDKNFTN